MPATLTSIDGAITPTGEALISPSDDGLLRGDGVFEVVRLYGGRPYALGEHLDRLERSAARIELPVARTELEPEIAALLSQFGAEDGQMRVVITRGGRRLLFTEVLPSWEPTIALATVTYSPTVILTGVKSLSYAANMEATRIAKSKGAGEALLITPGGVVMEAPTSSLFWVTPEGTVRTPSIDTGILDSITRAHLLELADVEQGSWGVEEPLGAAEAFLASTTRELHAVSAIDGAGLPAAPGPVTDELSTKFRELVAANLAAETA